MKIIRIDGRFESREVQKVLVAAFSPFGSLTEGVDGELLASLMIRYVQALGDDQLSLAVEVMKLIRGTTTENSSSVQFSETSVTLITPTSGTEIQLVKNNWISINFGVSGSESRATQILAGIEKKGAQPQVWLRGEEIFQRYQYLEFLKKNAQDYHDNIIGLRGTNYYSPEYQAMYEQAAVADLEFFSQLQ